VRRGSVVVKTVPVMRELLAY